MLECTNSLQVFLQTARLNFLDLPFQVKKVTDKLELVKSDPCGNNTSNFARLDSFLEITLPKERAQITRFNREFSKNDFIENVIEPFTSNLIQEINNAFAIPEHLNGFTAFDPQKLPNNLEDLENYGTALVEELGRFYGAPYTMDKDSRPKLIDVESLKVQFKAFKYFAFKERYEYEDEQQSKLESALKEKPKSENRLETLGDLMAGRKRLREQKKINLLETEIDSLKKTLKFTFDGIFQRMVQ